METIKMNEVWKRVKGYEKSHEISNLGRIRTIDRKVFRDNSDESRGYYNRKGKMIYTAKTKHGYIKTTLSKNGISKSEIIHRIVAINFIPNPENKPCVNHIDSNKQNNRVDNLEWCSYQENMNHAKKIGGLKNIRGEKMHNSKLKESHVLEIKNRLENGESHRSLAEEFNVHKSTITRINSKKIWKHVLEKEPINGATR